MAAIGHDAIEREGARLVASAAGGVGRVVAAVARAAPHDEAQA